MELAFAPTAAVAVVAGLAGELRLFAPGRAPGRWEATLWSTGWLLLALAVAVGIALGRPVGERTTVYLIERSLSLDNVFLFSLLLAYFLVSSEPRGRVILIGIAGALLLHGLAIAGGVALVESVETRSNMIRDQRAQPSWENLELVVPCVNLGVIFLVVYAVALAATLAPAVRASRIRRSAQISVTSGASIPRRAGSRPGGWLGAGRAGADGLSRMTGRSCETVRASPWCEISSGSPSTRV